MRLKKLLFKIFHWESWHYHLKYIPIAPLWLWHCIKSRSVWFFSTSNPTITFAGFEGETKMEIYRQLQPGTYPTTILIRSKMTFSEVLETLHASGIRYPFIVKPDAGSMGYMFRKIRTEEELRCYHEYMSFDYVLQEYVDYKLEASIFYYRMPDADKGVITGFLIKTPPRVTGDGISTLEQLINANPDLRFRNSQLLEKHKANLQSIPAPGAEIILSTACNRSQGAKIVNAAHEIDDRLLQVFDGISHYSKHFYYGRYDLKCASVEDLKQGKNFSILEFNGAGAGIQHVYGNGLSLVRACKTIARHWRVLYQISAINHKEKGIPYESWKEGNRILRQSMRQLKELERLDKNFSLLS